MKTYDQPQKDNSTEVASKRMSKRTAAVEARQRIADCLNAEMVTAVFSFSRECHKMEMMIGKILQHSIEPVGWGIGPAASML